MKKDHITLAIVQRPPVYMNVKASMDVAEIIISEAAEKNTDLIVFPETWLPGYPAWLDYAPEVSLWDHPPVKKLFNILYNQSVHEDGAILKRLTHLAKEKSIDIVMGAHEREGNTLYNTMYFINRTGHIFPHRKLTPTYTEKLIWGVGDGSTLPTIDTDYGILGGLICWEHWMPFARAAMHAKHEQIHIAQWPYVKELHQLCSRHYAFEGQCFVIASGAVLSKLDMLEGIQSLRLENGKEALELIDSIPLGNDDLVLKGGSAVIKPDAHYHIEPSYGSKETIFTNLDLADRPEGNLFLDTDGHYARPDIFNLTVDTSVKKNITFLDKD